MCYYKVFTILFLSIIVTSCGTDSEPEAQVGIWSQVGLEDQQINVLEFSKEYLYAASEESLLRKNIQPTLEEWEELNLKIDTETSEFGDILYTDEKLYSVVRNTVEYHSLPENYISLYKSDNDGENWDAIEITLEGREKPYVINRIAENRGTSNSLYADWHFIFKSIDSGETWSNLTDNVSVGVSEFLYVSKDHLNQIWTGGWNNIFSPYLAKSDDGGESWTNLNEQIYSDGDATVYAATVHPEDEHVVMVSLVGLGSGNAIRKSVDGGQNWTTVLEGYNIQALKNGLNAPNRVYASGRSTTGHLFVAISEDYGESWEIEEYEEGASGIQTNDMIVVEVNGHETLYFATTKGVYSYTFEE